MKQRRDNEARDVVGTLGLSLIFACIAGSLTMSLNKATHTVEWAEQTRINMRLLDKPKADDDWSCPTCDDADPRCPEWEAKR